MVLINSRCVVRFSLEGSGQGGGKLAECSNEWFWNLLHSYSTLKVGEISNYAEKNPLNTSSRPDCEETLPLLW